MIARMKARQILLAGVGLCVGFAGAETVFAQATPAASPAQSASVTVPFVGCASDGQVGPLKAPVGKSEVVAISAAMAQRLAYYQAEDSPGVLAPRGWHCFSTYGSNGASLFVSPDPIDSKTVLLSSEWKGFPGSAVQISVSDGGTSGRFEVAKVIARVFPASDFPFGPYPGDELRYRGKNIVEFETPTNSQGLGTDSRLQMNASPIDGVAIVAGADTDLTQLSARIPASDSDLIPAMVAQAESEAAADTAQ
jgi:hypothetical protein